MPNPAPAMKRIGRVVATRARLTLARLLSKRSYDLRNTIVVSGSPRSGTTWLAQALSAIPGSSVLFEPDHLEHVAEAREAGLSWRTYAPPGSEWPEGRRFLADVLRGKILTPWTMREISMPRLTSTWIIKFVRANRMLAWIAEQFPVRAPILLLRHPCAVVASQLRSPGWENPTKRTEHGFTAGHPQFVSILEGLTAPEEFLAATWAIDTLVPLSAPRPHPWQLSTYERLVRDPRPEVEAIFARWPDVPIPARLWAGLGLPSSTAVTARRRSADELVGGWRNELDAGQRRRILAVAAAFGVDFYGEDPDPDLDRLTNFAGSAG